MFRSMENLDPVTHELLTSQFTSQSELLEDVGAKWNIPILEEDAKLYQENPELGMGRASAIGLSIYAPYAAEGVWGAMAPAAYDAMVPAVGAEQAGMLAAQTGDFGAYGLGKTMEAANYATQSGLAQSMGGLLSGGGAAGTNKQLQNLMVNQGMGLMNPQQEQAPPPNPPRPPQKIEPLPDPYGTNSLSGPPPGMTREEWLRRKQLGLI